MDKSAETKFSLYQQWGMLPELALEAHDLLRGDRGGEIPGVRLTEEVEDIATVHTVTVLNSQGSRIMQKPEGIYVTIHCKELAVNHQGVLESVSDLVTKHLKKFITLSSLEAPVLVAGLGNWKSTPDALGPRVISQLMATRHLYGKVPDEILEGVRPVATIAPGVLGMTGIESADILREDVTDAQRTDLRHRHPAHVGNLVGGGNGGIDYQRIVGEVFYIDAVLGHISLFLALAARASLADGFIKRCGVLSPSVCIHYTKGAGLYVGREVNREGAFGKVPRHSRIYYKKFVARGKSGESVVYLVVKLGMGFHIYVQIRNGHPALLCHGTNDRPRGIILRAERFNQKLGHRAFSAAYTSCNTYFIHVLIRILRTVEDAHCSKLLTIFILVFPLKESFNSLYF